MPSIRLHTIDPSTTPKTFTLFLLHGHGSSATIFAHDLFSHRTSTGLTLRDALPSARWVFPCSGLQYCTQHADEQHSWFDFASLTDLEAHGALQIAGLQQRAGQLGDAVAAEVAALAGRSDRLVVGGFSQGGATDLWVFLTGAYMQQQQHQQQHQHQQWRPGRLAGVLGFSTWLPFYSEAARAVQNVARRRNADRVSGAEEKDGEGALDAERNVRCVQAVARRFRELVGIEDTELSREAALSMLETPVFLAHGTDDDAVNFKVGMNLKNLLADMGFKVEWREYSGMERGGHWIKEPEEFDHILEFVKKHVEEALESNV